MRGDIKTEMKGCEIKKKSLKTYEGILKQPNIQHKDTNEIAQKCKLCFKLFATSERIYTAEPACTNGYKDRTGKSNNCDTGALPTLTKHV